MRYPSLFLFCLIALAACASGAREQFDARIRSKSEDVTLCYIQLLRDDRNAQGEIELSVTIDGAGKVIAAELVKNTFPDDRVGVCVAAVLKGIDFPANAQNKTVTFTYPVLFTSEIPIRE